MGQWMEFFLKDEALGTFVPIIVYWVYSGFYVLLEHLDGYRMHTVAEEKMKNLVSKSTVVKGVLLQQLIQAMVALILLKVTGEVGESGITLQPSLMVQAIQFLIAMFVLDTWQYFLHRFMHHNKFLYRTIHSRHHRLIVPWPFGAMYNHPLEGLLLDTTGGVLSYLFSGMTPRTSIFFFTFATIKGVDDHCGLMLPGNPFHIFFGNNTAYHDIHHQHHGVKYNFSQPFFVFWDKLLGTHMPYRIVKRPDGGFEAAPAKKH
ncbi:sphinganine C4-monooxygenase 2 [Cryptomeria japonica]|uniref:sphinganine C4-monooxygenase 2 n=1 Tax=Cryptomeria japonica TaxID=3369 RepID=UPI0027D9FF79|nr:sphinganine C4-monooxygenase 2 [Cryptomeria japonica]XP_057818399.2 sphinganine C4-monooxygenase 2 [Cryptomeria japonica]